MKKTKKTTVKNNLIDDILSSISPGEGEKIEKKMLLAAKIEDGIKAKGWKNIDLLKALGKDNPSIVTKWLSGTHNFTVETLVELEQALDISLLDIEEKEVKIVTMHYVMVSQPKAMFQEAYSEYDLQRSENQTNIIFSTGSSQLGNYIKCATSHEC